MRRLAAGLVMLALWAGPVRGETGQAAALLARPDAALTLGVAVVGLPELLAFVAAVGGSEARVEPDVRGQVRQVALQGVRVEDAFQRLLREHGLVARRVGAQLVISRDPNAPALMPPLLPERSRPELITPPTP